MNIIVFRNFAIALVALFALVACDGEEDQGDDPIACLDIYEPVCGKAEATINCVTTPCPTHMYSTYGNSCYAELDEALIAFPGECEGLENQVSFADPPVNILEFADDPEEGSNTDILLAEIDGDVLNLEVQYSGGCSDHEFTLYVSNDFMESNPVQSETVLSHIEQDPCDSVVTDDISFDLLPIREFYRRSYGEDSSGIILLGIEFYDW